MLSLALLLLAGCGGGGSGNGTTPTAPAMAPAAPPPDDNDADDWLQYGRDVERSGANNFQTLITKSNVASLKLKWTADIPPGAFASPIAHDGTVYIADLGGTITALNVASGHVQWTRSVPDSFISTPALDNGVLYEGTFTGHFYAIDANSGAIIREYPVPDTLGGYEGSPLVADGVVTIGRTNLYETKQCLVKNQLVQFSLNDNRLVNSAALTKSPDNGVGVWSSPAIGPDGYLYVATGNSCYSAQSPNASAILKIHPSTLSIIWAAHGPPAGPDRDDDFGATPVFANGMVIDGAKDGFVYAVDTSTGQLRWKTSAGIANGQIIGSLATDGHAIYVPYFTASSGGAIVALSLNGDVLWTVPTAIGSNGYDSGGVISAPTVSNGIVFEGYTDLACTKAGQATCTGVSALDAATGTVLWRYTLPGNVWSRPTVVGGGLIVVNMDHTHAYCFTPNGR